MFVNSAQARERPEPFDFARERKLGRLPRTVLLGDLFEQTGTPVPVRFRHGFLNRPWPTHALYERIVDAELIPFVRPDNPTARRPIEIVGDRSLRASGRRTSLNGDVLVCFNLGLLTRDWAMRTDELVTLMQFDDKRTPAAIARALNSARFRVNGHLPGMYAQPPDGKNVAYQFSPDLAVIDRR